ncbi:MAG: hypothetical protein MN733_01675 [Nitrososphaera sp.]|nr:hypothetical protein [Nitrososphaera sp.]
MEYHTLKAVSKMVRVPYPTLWYWVDMGYVPFVLLDKRKLLNADGIKIVRQLATVYNIKTNTKGSEI